MEEKIRQIKKLVFVCTGNTCRSPMAEIFYRSMNLDDEIEVFSRGLVVHFSEPINPKAVTVLNNHELDFNSHVSRLWKAEECDRFTLILTMTESQKKKICSEYEVESFVYTLTDYAGESGDVVDPYGGSIMDYEECFGEISRLVRKAAYRIARENELYSKSYVKEDE